LAFIVRIVTTYRSTWTSTNVHHFSYSGIARCPVWL